VVRISTYRDERKLLGLIAAVCAASTIALVQIYATRTGEIGPIARAATILVLGPQRTFAAALHVGRAAATTIGELPRLSREDGELRARLAALAGENARLAETLAARPDLAAAERLARAEPRGTAARVVGYDPENVSRVATIDRGANDGLARDAGVLDADGVVGRILAVGPASSTVLFVTDAASEIPAIVQRGRWWGIAQGTSTSVSLRYISQDAKLRVGDLVVTGAGRSFAGGRPIGRIARVSHPAGALYQSAIVQPAVAFGRLDRVLVVGR